MKKNIKKEGKLISSGDEFKQLLAAKDSFLILFTSQSCGYCQLAKKNIQQVISDFPQLDFYQLQLADAAEIFQSYDINSVPVIKVFKAGQSVYTGFGVRSVNDLYYQLSSYFNKVSFYQKESN
ncbi:thioredoxin family protein [Halanaerobium praevalens]|uniref:Thioredoxin domain-containing protein n=1 Tax=Halanaerobium praevalens (strain ATCC 33744 / DSM 2228 / GSL) TaxID=572479 RepID=E3DLE1_HALPG|nr:thioredoxin family protein [Halanaerobium praevalens]ADO77180.1 Thioredoxin domain-containing protein [Halanaerobium praevalens DSM 2228]